jgi:nucleoside-diphosphate-sugar epimerase
MRILIIGGTGLISTGITRLLVERGDDVTLYNRGLHEARGLGGVQTILGDRRHFSIFESQMQEAGAFDCVIDMVCFEAEEARSLVRAFAGRIGHLIFCSTVDVYTKPARRYPIREDEARRPDPAFTYALNKAECEDILSSAHDLGRFPLTIIRPAATYGEGGSPVHTLGWSTVYLDRLRKGRPIVVHGDGTTLWSWSYAEDVARAFVNATGAAKAFGRSYHVTGEEWLTWNRYYQGLAQALGGPEPNLVHIPTDLLAQALPQQAHWCRVNFQFDNIFDNAAARADLGFQYTVRWDEGARRMIAWLDARGSIEDCDSDPLVERVLRAWERHGAEMIEQLADMREVA